MLALLSVCKAFTMLLSALLLHTFPRAKLQFIIARIAVSHTLNLFFLACCMCASLPSTIPYWWALMWRICVLLRFSSEIFYWHIEYDAAMYDHIWMMGQERVQDISKVTKVSLPKPQETSEPFIFSYALSWICLHWLFKIIRYRQTGRIEAMWFHSGIIH